MVRHLVTADGAAGYADAMPYDRVHATCAVAAIPYAWVEQVRPGGMIVTPWQPTITYGWKTPSGRPTTPRRPTAPLPRWTPEASTEPSASYDRTGWPRPSPDRVRGGLGHHGRSRPPPHRPGLPKLTHQPADRHVH